jgi:hypothetical protein
LAARRGNEENAKRKDIDDGIAGQDLLQGEVVHSKPNPAGNSRCATRVSAAIICPELMPGRVFPFTSALGYIL